VNFFVGLYSILVILCVLYLIGYMTGRVCISREQFEREQNVLQNVLVGFMVSFFLVTIPTAVFTLLWYAVPALGHAVLEVLR